MNLAIVALENVTLRQSASSLLRNSWTRATDEQPSFPSRAATANISPAPSPVAQRRQRVAQHVSAGDLAVEKVESALADGTKSHDKLLLPRPRRRNSYAAAHRQRSFKPPSVEARSPASELIVFMVAIRSAYTLQLISFQRIASWPESVPIKKQGLDYRPCCSPCCSISGESYEVATPPQN